MPMIDKVLYRESIAVLSGKFGTYKSFIAVGMACSLATGTPWFGRSVSAAVPVIYAAAEGAYGIGGRIEAWERKYARSVPDSLYLIGVSARLNQSADMAELGALIQETGAQVVVFDTLHASTPGLDENDAGDMGAAVDTLRTLRDTYRITSLLVHHTGHAGQRARGSSSLEDDADTSFVINLEGEDRRPENIRTLVHRKAKDSRLIDDIPLYLDMIELSDGEESGVVRERTAFEHAAGQTGSAPDVGQIQAVQDVQPWTRVAQPHPNADLQRQILQVLHDIAELAGLSEAKARAAVAGRWFGGRTGREPGQLNVQSFEKAWRKVLALQDGLERRIVVPGELGSQSFVINPGWFAEVDKSE